MFLSVVRVLLAVPRIPPKSVTLCAACGPVRRLAVMSSEPIAVVSPRRSEPIAGRVYSTGWGISGQLGLGVPTHGGAKDLNRCRPAEVRSGVPLFRNS